MKPLLKLLILEDNYDDILILKEMLAEVEATAITDAIFEAMFLETLGRGIQYLETTHVDLVILDLNLPDSQGLDTLQTLRETRPAREIPIIVLTVLDDKETGIKAVQMGAQEYLVKNEISPRSLTTSIRYAIERQRLNIQLQKETEGLEQSENQFIEMITNTPDGVVILESDPIVKIHYMNPAAEALLSPGCKKKLGEIFGTPTAVDETETREIDIPCEKDTPVTLEIRGVKIDWKEKDAWLLSLRDITGHKRLLKEFQDDKEQLDVTLRSIADGVIAADETGVIRLINWVAGQITGWPQEMAMGKPLAEILKIENKSRGQTLITPGETMMNRSETAGSSGADDWWLTARNGNEIPIEYSYAPVMRENQKIGEVLVIRDVTETREMEQEVVRAQNLEALGILAAGIAHEYSNILTSTLGYISLVKRVLEDDHIISPRLKKAEDAGLRAKKISYRLFTFARGGEPQKVLASITETIKQAVRDTLYKRYPAIKVNWQITSGIWPISFDIEQVYLAVANIIKNAAESMACISRDTGNWIDIKIENNKIPRGKSLILKAGHYIKITIADQGCGIAEEHLSRVCDPYFTTKKGAEGLGLTTAYSILRKHGGELRIKSKKNRGTRITLLLPAALPQPQPKKTIASIPTPPGELEPSEPRKKRILVMDDEEMIREIAKEMLEYLGYEAVIVQSGEEALESYRWAKESGRPFELVMLDLVIPSGMGGRECIRKLREIDPQVIAIVSSGYSDDPIIANYRDYGFNGVLDKPYKIHELQEVLEKITKA